MNHFEKGKNLCPVPRSPFPVPRKLSCAIGLVAAVCLSGAAHASDIVDISVEVDGWAILPISDVGATTHLIAARNDDGALATDIDVVLYEKTVDGWSGSAYDPSVTKEDAMLDIADEFGLTDPFGEDWLIDLDPDNAIGSALPRVAFGKGFFVADPLYEVALLLNDPEPLASGAEGAGLPAGSSAINTGSVSGGSGIGGPSPTGGCGCGDNPCLQTSIAVGIDAYLFDNNLTIEDIEQAAHDELHSILSCCIPWTWTRGTPTCTCTPTTGWTFVSSYVINVMSGQRLICKYTRSVTKVCTRTRIRRCFDCSRTTTTQTRTTTGSQTASSFVNFQGGPIPPCSGPPAVACGTTGSTSSSAWLPAPPACP